MKSYIKEMEAAAEAVVQAARLTRAVQEGIDSDVLEKKDKSPVTVADFGAQAVVCKALMEKFPDDPVIGEEDSADLRKEENSLLLLRLMEHVERIFPNVAEDEVLGWIDRGKQDKFTNRFWTLDPVDGTKGFLRKDQYAVSLGLVVDGQVVAGALCCPNLAVDFEKDAKKGVVCFAARAEGAFQEALDGTRRRKIEVSRIEKAEEIRTCESVEKAHSSHSDSRRIAESLKIEASPVRIDSQAKYVAVARGDAEAYLRLPRDGIYREKIWDHAGGVIVVEEAGGRVTDIKGRPLDFSKGRRLENNLGVIVSNAINHDTIINTIEKLGIGRF